MTLKEFAEFVVSNSDKIENDLNRCTSGNFAHTIANIKQIMYAYKQLAEEALQED